jgi:uncharacterized protein
MIRSFVAALVLILAGCFGSPHTHYYSLTPVESAKRKDTSEKPLQVVRVLIPASLDRQSMVQWSGAGELTVSDRDRWAAPLDGVIQRVLAEDLRQRLTTPVLLPGDPAPDDDVRGIVVNVQHFAAENGKRVVLLVDWSMITETPPTVILTRSEDILIPLRSDDTPGVVSAMSGAVAILSDRIVSALVSM